MSLISLNMTDADGIDRAMGVVQLPGGQYAFANILVAPDGELVYATSRSLSVIDHSVDDIRRGYVYNSWVVFDGVGSDDERSIVFDVPGIEVVDTWVKMHISADLSAEYDVYEAIDTDIAGWDTLPMINRNRNSGNTSEGTFKHDSTSVSPIVIAGKLLIDHDNFGGAKEPGTSVVESIWDLKEGAKTGIILKSNAAGNKITVKLMLIQHNGV